MIPGLFVDRDEQVTDLTMENIGKGLRALSSLRDIYFDFTRQARVGKFRLIMKAVQKSPMSACKQSLKPWKGFLVLRAFASTLDRKGIPLGKNDNNRCEKIVGTAFQNISKVFKMLTSIEDVYFNFSR